MSDINVSHMHAPPHIVIIELTSNDFCRDPNLACNSGIQQHGKKSPN